MQNSGFALLVGLLVSFSASAKITVFSHAGVVQHVLASPELAKVTGVKPLVDLQLMELEIAQKEEIENGEKIETKGAIGLPYIVDLTYSHLKDGFETCKLKASVVNKKDPKAPEGVTANMLSAPHLSKIQCAE